MPAPLRPIRNLYTGHVETDHRPVKRRIALGWNRYYCEQCDELWDAPSKRRDKTDNCACCNAICLPTGPAR